MRGPEFIRADEVTVTMAEGEGVRAVEAPLLFDVASDRVVVLWDARPQGGPVIAFGLASTTSYAVAMAILRCRRRMLRTLSRALDSAVAVPSR